MSHTRTIGTDCGIRIKQCTTVRRVHDIEADIGSPAWDLIAHGIIECSTIPTRQELDTLVKATYTEAVLDMVPTLRSPASQHQPPADPGRPARSLCRRRVSVHGHPVPTLRAAPRAVRLRRRHHRHSSHDGERRSPPAPPGPAGPGGPLPAPSHRPRKITRQIGADSSTGCTARAYGNTNDETPRRRDLRSSTSPTMGWLRTCRDTPAGRSLIPATTSLAQHTPGSTEDSPELGSRQNEPPHRLRQR